MILPNSSSAASPSSPWNTSESTLPLNYSPHRSRRTSPLVEPYPAPPYLGGQDAAPESPSPELPPVDEPEPAPPQVKKQKQDMGGNWMYNPGWTGDNHPCLQGWLFIQGWFDWGACLSWHVQRSHFINPGKLHWQCWVWYFPNRDNSSWQAFMLLTEDIPESQQDKFQHWMIHEEGDAYKKNAFIISPSKEHGSFKGAMFVFCLFSSQVKQGPFLESRVV